MTCLVPKAPPMPNQRCQRSGLPHRFGDAPSPPGPSRAFASARTALWLAGTLAPALAVLLVASCSRPPQQPPEPGVVALVDGHPITARDLNRAFWHGPDHVRRKALQPGGRHFLLDHVIGDYLILREARRRKIGPTSSQIYEFHDGLMKEFLGEVFEPTVSPADVPEEEVRAEYERVRPTLAAPETVRIELAYFAERERAEEMTKRALAAQRDRNDEELDLVMRVETEPWPEGKAHIPSRGIFTREEANQYYGEELAEIAFSKVPPEIVHTEPLPLLGGWVVLVVPLHHPGEPPPPFEEVAEGVRDQAFMAFRERALNDFVKTFRSEHEVVVNQENMDLVNWVVELPEPPAELIGPSTETPPPPPGAGTASPGAGATSDPD